MYILCNLYAPTRDHKLDQNTSISLVNNELATFDNENIIIGGDFNIYLNPKLDKIESMSNKNDNPVYRKNICSLMESMSLTDCFRDNTRRYTWHALGMSSRLDYWLISEHLLNEIQSYKILLGLHSDHSILKMELGINESTQGKGFWKFNNLMLHDDKYVKEIKKIIEKCENEYSTLDDKGLAWEIQKWK